MSGSHKIKVLFVAGFGPVVRDRKRSEKFYAGDLGLSFNREEGGYLHTEKLEGVKHFALWPLSQAAQSCFETDAWPKDIPVPHSWLEFDVEDVEAASEELKRKGYKLLVSARKEPWGQTVTRLLSPEGILVGVTFTPSMRKKRTDASATTGA
ncbi:MAG: VOC family protein [Verrucomicrobiota bacterium]|nr:VOC family protein [Verrucomicrobiota bacterium]